MWSRLILKPGILEKGAPCSELAKKYRIPHNIISGWKKKADTIKMEYRKGILAPQHKKLRVAKFEDIEEATVKWFINACSNNIPIDGPRLIKFCCQPRSSWVEAIEWMASPLQGETWHRFQIPMRWKCGSEESWLWWMVQQHASKDFSKDATKAFSAVWCLKCRWNWTHLEMSAQQDDALQWWRMSWRQACWRPHHRTSLLLIKMPYTRS